jgi:hypothetical protein
VEWTPKDVSGASLFDDATGVHHGNSVDKSGEHGRIVTDHNKCHAMPLTYRSHQGNNLCLKRGIELARRFVRDHQLGTARDSLCNHNSLPLPSTQLVRICAIDLARLIEADFSEQLFDARPAIPPIHAHMRSKRLRNLIADANDRIQSQRGILWDESNLNSSNPSQGGLGQGQQIAPPEADRATVVSGTGWQQVQQGGGESALARTGFSQDAEEFAGAYFQAGLVQGMSRLIAIRRVGHRQPVNPSERLRGSVRRKIHISVPSSP